MATILVVDDDKSVRELIVKMVRSTGHEALSARNGQEAVSIFRRHPDLFDLVITDIKMPVMDGLEAIRSIREIRPHAAIICVSGYCEQECPEGTAFLPKPFTFEQVRHCVGEALALHTQ